MKTSGDVGVALPSSPRLANGGVPVGQSDPLAKCVRCGEEATLISIAHPKINIVRPRRWSKCKNYPKKTRICTTADYKTAQPAIDEWNKINQPPPRSMMRTPW